MAETSTPNPMIKYWTIIAFVIMFSIGYGALQFQSNANAEDVIKVEAKNEKQDEAINEMKVQAARTDEKLKNIKESLERQTALLVGISRELSSDNR